MSSAATTHLAFVLVYLACVIVIGMPVMMSEILMGRRGRRNPVATMKLLGEEEAATTETTEAAAETVATHDCAGACGMTNVPEDQLTEIDGKWYCAGCAAKAKEEDHSGHDHG